MKCYLRVILGRKGSFAAERLRDEIDPEVWDLINSPKSRLFQKPTTGKIAIKVINHFGDEVMKVYPVT